MGDDLTEALNAFLARYETELIGLRRDLHAHPEPANAERRTTRLVADRLAEAGLRPMLLQGSTGLYVDIGPGGSRVALRADLDALPMDDEKDVPYRSAIPGMCHACGHDAHTAMLVGAGLFLAQRAASGLLADGVRLALVLAAPLLAVAGLVAALVTAAAKWLLVGRLRPGAYPLWSSFVWRNELADTFVEVVAAPWFAHNVAATPLLNAWFRLMGAKIGRGVWCETYWLPETDLVELGDGATVNQGTVVQTHLFHDRMLAMDRVILKRGATLGPNSVILPAATLGRHATVGPVSLVMRGESVPDKTFWIGNPIGPWV